MSQPRALRIRGVDYPVRLPSARDPRLHLGATITSIQVMGQAFLGWELSIAQILVCLVTCAVLEVSLLFWERKELVWPASALLTGNGVALILRVNGTEHGDWWSLHGWYIFAATAGFALLSKHLIRFRGRPVVNPSNLGLVVCFLLLGTDVVNPLDFWWGPLSAPLAAVYVVLAAGAITVTWRLGLIPMSAAFWGVFAASLAVVSGAGHCISARWSVEPVCGMDFWLVVVTSPEILIFMFFMITDPMTTPQARRPRVVFGAAVGLVSALLVAPLQTEFGAKVAVLAGLVVVCAARPLLALAGQRDVRVPIWGVRPAAAVGVPLALSALVLAGAPAREPGPPATTITADSLVGRPEVSVPTGAVPPVTVSPEVQTVIGDRAARQGEQMGHDLVTDLLIEADAHRSGDTALAATAIAGPRLTAFEEVSEIPPYEFTTMTVVLVRDPEDPQAVPRFGIRASGFRGATEMDSIFVLQDVGGVWILTDEMEPA
jgi:Na+-translocating ferredoxin:NAD+ oxidoreductase RnfD subunit